MSKFHGILGFSKTQEVEPGVYEDVVTEKIYSGYLIKNYRQHDNSGTVIDNVNISNEISVTMDLNLFENMFALTYVKFLLPVLGGYWKVKSVELQYPNVHISVGGVYNGPKPTN